MPGSQHIPFPSRAKFYRDRRVRRLAEKLAAALMLAALVSAGLFSILRIHGAVENFAQAQYRASDIYYPNCAAARAAGAAPIYIGQPGYRPGLDADSDGIACEPFRNWGAND